MGGSPFYEHVEKFAQPEATSRTYTYSPDGRYFAYVLPTRSVDQSDCLIFIGWANLYMQHPCVLRRKYRAAARIADSECHRTQVLPSWNLPVYLGETKYDFWVIFVCLY